MTSQREVDVDEVRAVALEVRAAMVEMPDEPFAGAKTIFPQIWCEWGSIAVAEILSIRGLGEWTFVTAGRNDSASGHAWLERRGREEGDVVSVDITLDQFDEWNDPFIGRGHSPATRLFTDIRYAGPWREWPALLHNDTYQAYAQKMTAFMSEH